jgi:hypothetical protein
VLPPCTQLHHEERGVGLLKKSFALHDLAADLDAQAYPRADEPLEVSSDVSHDLHIGHEQRE